MKNLIFGFLLLLGLIILGCNGSNTKNIYVDHANTSGPWNGTTQNPYETIQDGLDAAREGHGDRVWVKEGQYRENIILKRNTQLNRYQRETVTVIGDTRSPTIISRGGNTITGLIIEEGGTSGIEVNLGAILNNQNEIYISVLDCNIRNTNRGIEVITPNNLDFGDGIRKSVYLNIIHNYIHGISGDGIKVNLNGPRTGELQISLDIKDNVLQSTFTGIFLRAKGQGPNPNGFVRALYAGYIRNNLIFDSNNGIDLYSENLGNAAPFILNNTIANNSFNGINVEAKEGPDGRGSSNPSVERNIISGNDRCGYQEFSRYTSARRLNYNIFFQNGGNGVSHYYDSDTEQIITTETGLNTPIIDGKVVFFSGTGNLINNPMFTKGGFPFGNIINYGKAAEFFLVQEETSKSPAVDGANITAIDANLDNRTTHIDYIFDTDIVDIGFHYKA